MSGAHGNPISRGALLPLPGQRVEYQQLNTIMEEMDGSDASPTTQSSVTAAGVAEKQRQCTRTSQLPLNEKWLLHGRQPEGHAQKIELWLGSPMSDHFPTPRGLHFLSAPILPSSPSTTSASQDADFEDDRSSPEEKSPSSPWNRSGSSSTNITNFSDSIIVDFEDIYNASDDEAGTCRLPLPGLQAVDHRCATGLARPLTHSTAAASASSPSSAFLTSGSTRRMLPQLTIPALAAAAGAEPDPKLCTSPMAPTPSAQVPMSPAFMSFMQKHHALGVPDFSTPPSLDGSLSSEQMSHMSAHASSPPTPIIGATDDVDGADSWSGVQLQPGALATLQSLGRLDASPIHDNLDPERVIEISNPHSNPPPEETFAAEEQPTSEMTEMTERTEMRSHPLRLITSGVARFTRQFSPAQPQSLASLTRLDIPSPGGFFSGLSPQSRHTWHIPGITPIDSPPPPTSGAAERFYRLPWSEDKTPPVPGVSTGPPQDTAPAVLSTSPVEQIIEVPLSVESGDPLTAFRVQVTPIAAQHTPIPELPSPTHNTEACQITATATEEVPDSEQPDAADASSPIDEVVATEIVDDYHNFDFKASKQTTVSHLSRTEIWLAAQRAYFSGIADLTESHHDAKLLEAESPQTAGHKSGLLMVDGHTDPTNELTVISPARKKTVRFSEGIKSPALPHNIPTRLIHQESAYYRAFTGSLVRSHHTDVFFNRLPRFEALQAKRLLLQVSHRNQLLGKFQLKVVPQSAKKRMSANVVRGDDELVDDPARVRADKEADALSQSSLTMWHVAAMKLLNGGRLIAAPVHKRLAKLSRPVHSSSSRDRLRILDLGGQATCDWAWHVSLQYPNAKVYSVTTKAVRQLSNANVRGPPNHRQVAVEKLTRLPFDDCQFDLIRAAELQSVLKFVGEHGEDEWETCLRECYRVLKPGGYLEFALLDSDIINAGPLGNAKSVEFGFALQTLGYDPTPTKLFLGRLARAGFSGTRRAWLCLPVGPKPISMTRPALMRDSSGELMKTVEMEAVVTGSADNIAAVTGLAASWSWEQWLLRAEMEKTAGELRLADTVTAGPALQEAGKSITGVHAIVEEGRVTGAAWRMLRGFTCKPTSITMDTIKMMSSEFGDQ